ncbi:MAG: EAL domain-containing protein, partial [Burkholderiales bacterium]
AEDPLLVRLDRLCRTVHALNYFGRAAGDYNLFLSVQPGLLETIKDGHGRVFKRVLDLIGVETSRVVIEIPAKVNRDWRLLKHVIVNYRSRGYQIAVNHGGANDGWMAELGILYPDIVRLEASALTQRGGLGSLVDAVHRFGATLLVRDIETTQEMSAAIRAGADLLQGRFLGEPARAVAPVAKRAAIAGFHLGYAW